MTFDLAQFKTFFELDAKKKDLEKDLEKTKADIATLETQLIEVMEANDMPQITIDGSQRLRTKMRPSGY